MISYAALCFALRPEFPFATVDMYANVGHRYEGALPMLAVDGVQVDLRSLRDFRGITPSEIARANMPCSEGYLLDEIRNYVAGHQARGSRRSDEVRVEFVWRRYHMEENGTVVDDGNVVAASGTARELP